MSGSWEELDAHVEDDERGSMLAFCLEQLSGWRVEEGP